MDRKTKVISAFPGTGKTVFFENTKLDVIDSDSSKFSWLDHPNGERNPEFPANYIKHIKENIGKVDYILVSSHKEVRDALRENHIMYMLVYPRKDAKDNYLNRYRVRGSGEEFVKLLDDNWDNFIDQLDNEKVYMKVVLSPYATLQEIFEYERDEIMNPFEEGTGNESFSLKEFFPSITQSELQHVSNALKAYMEKAGVEMLPKVTVPGDTWTSNTWPLEISMVACSILVGIRIREPLSEVIDMHATYPLDKWGFGTPYYNGEWENYYNICLQRWRKLMEARK